MIEHKRKKSNGVRLFNFINTFGSNIIFGNASKRMNSAKIRKWFAHRIAFKYSSSSLPFHNHCAIIVYLKTVA